MAKNKMKSHRGACKRLKLKRPEKSYSFNQCRLKENAQIHGKITEDIRR